MRGYGSPVNDDLYDSGPSARGLWATSWLLGLVAAGCLIRLLTYAASDVNVQPELFVWLLVGAIAAVFSAACAVLAGIKNAEHRLAYQVQQPARD